MSAGAVNNSRERTGSGALFVGGLAAILASTAASDLYYWSQWA
jgi:hypothetical protein